MEKRRQQKKAVGAAVDRYRLEDARSLALGQGGLVKCGLGHVWSLSDVGLDTRTTTSAAMSDPCLGRRPLAVHGDGRQAADMAFSTLSNASETRRCGAPAVRG